MSTTIRVTKFIPPAARVHGGAVIKETHMLYDKSANPAPYQAQETTREVFDASGELIQINSTTYQANGAGLSYSYTMANGVGWTYIYGGPNGYIDEPHTSPPLRAQRGPGGRGIE